MKIKSFYTEEEAIQWAEDNGIRDYKLYPAEYFYGVELGYEENVKYEVVLESDHNPNGHLVAECLTLDDARLNVYTDWASYCDNDKRNYSKWCYYYEIHTTREHEDGEIEIVDIIDRIDVDNVK
jgi:hypothetical protein